MTLGLAHLVVIAYKTYNARKEEKVRLIQVLLSAPDKRNTKKANQDISD